MQNDFFIEFEDYCKTPGVDSGKASSYAKAIKYLCDYLKITEIDVQSIAHHLSFLTLNVANDVVMVNKQ